jgi:antitoxin HigA-1
MTKNPLLRGLPPVHPGELLREDVLPALGRPKAEKQPTTPAMALRIGKLCGNGPDLWINMQRAYDLDVAEKELAREIEKIPTLPAA